VGPPALTCAPTVETPGRNTCSHVSTGWTPRYSRTASTLTTTPTATARHNAAFRRDRVVRPFTARR